MIPTSRLLAKGERESGSQSSLPGDLRQTQCPPLNLKLFLN